MRDFVLTFDFDRDPLSASAYKLRTEEAHGLDALVALSDFLKELGVSSVVTKGTTWNTAAITIMGDHADEVSAEDAARQLGITCRTLWRWRDEGKIKESRRVGNKVLFSSDEVERLRSAKDGQVWYGWAETMQPDPISGEMTNVGMGYDGPFATRAEAMEHALRMCEANAEFESRPMVEWKRPDVAARHAPLSDRT